MSICETLALCATYIILGLLYIIGLCSFEARPLQTKASMSRTDSSLPKMGGASGHLPYDVVRQIANPDFTVRDIAHPNGFTMKLVDESPLVGGSKQRIIAQILRGVSDNVNEIIYAGPGTGYAQLAISYICKLLGLSATIFVDTDQRSQTRLTRNAQLLGAHINYFDPRVKGKRLMYIQKKAELYAAKSKRRYILPFGMMDGSSVKLYCNAFNPLRAILSPAPDRLWVVAGSGLIFSSLGAAFPNTKLMVVQVGKKIWPNQLDGFNHELFVSDLRFTDDIPDPHPPYDTLLNYDGKLWPFVLKYGKPGDAIWNTAGSAWTPDRINKVNNTARGMILKWAPIEARITEEALKRAYPFVTERLDPPLVMFENLKAEIKSKSWSGPEVVRDYGIDHYSIDGISNHFTESHRLDCVVNVKEKLSPRKFWETHRAKIGTAAFRMGRGTLDNFVPDWREAMRTMSAYKECTTFNPFILVGAIKRYFPNTHIRMLDPSMGWGDRLIGALACDIDEYVGFDPNIKLHGCYTKIAKTLGGRTRTTFIPAKFSRENLSKYKSGMDRDKGGMDRDQGGTLIPFDFAFTSPPYYNFEIYEGTESDIKKGYKEWLDDMYIQYLKDMVYLVKPGGYVMVSTSNIYGANIGDDTKRIVEEAGAEFVEICTFIHNYTRAYGILYPGTPRSLYVFKKPAN